jgi:5,10-methylenetetrahydromethanopterin reductase
MRHHGREMIDCGFAFIPHQSADDTISVIKAGERLGFESGWIPDQTFYSDPFVLLAACAVATQRLTLGLGVTNPYTRHPALTARAAATVDELSRGRFILAFGAGNLPELLTPLGIERTAAAARLREAVEVTKRLLAGETVHHKSRTLVADGVRLLAPARPRLPVYVAARSPGTITVAGEVADGAILGSLFAPERLDPAMAQIAAAARANGRSQKDIDIVVWGSAHLTDFPGADLDAFRVEVARVIGRASESTLRTGGISDERIAQLLAAHGADRAKGIARLLTEDEIRGVSLFGDAQQCRAILDRLARSGVRRYVLLLRETSAERHIALLTHFAHNVMGTA